MTFFIKKYLLWIILSLVMSLTCAALLFFNAAFEQDMVELQLARAETQQMILTADRSKKSKAHYDRLRQQMRTEKFDEVPASYKEVAQTIERALIQHHLFEAHLKRDPVQERGSQKYQPFTLLVSMTLDTDIFNFLETLSRELNGVMVPRFLTIVKDGEETLKGEIRFYLVTQSSAASSFFPSQKITKAS